MEIKTDIEGRNVIMGMCDLALKKGGIDNIDIVSKVINAIKLIEEKKEKAKNE